MPLPRTGAMFDTASRDGTDRSFKEGGPPFWGAVRIRRGRAAHPPKRRRGSPAGSSRPAAEAVKNKGTRLRFRALSDAVKSADPAKSSADVTFITSVVAPECNVWSDTQSEGRRLVMRHFPKRILIDVAILVASVIIIAIGAWFGFHGSSAHLLAILAR